LEKITLRIHCFGKFWNQITEFLIEGEKRNYHFVFSDKLKCGNPFHLVLFADYAGLDSRKYAYAKRRRLLLLQEPGSSRHYIEKVNECKRFEFVFTHDKRLLESVSNAYETPFGTNWMASDVDAINPPLPKNKLLSYMGALHENPPVGSGHALRNEIAGFCLERGDVDCYGKGIYWIENVRESLEGYAFTVAVENCQQDYYFTEKLINCFLMDTVPIYRGCSGIGRYFDQRGIFQFDTFEQFKQIVSSLNWDIYDQMVPYVKENRDRAIKNHWATIKGIFQRVANELDKKEIVTEPEIRVRRFAPLFHRLMGKLNLIKSN